MSGKVDTINPAPSQSLFLEALPTLQRTHDPGAVFEGERRSGLPQRKTGAHTERFVEGAQGGIRDSLSCRQDSVAEPVRFQQGFVARILDPYRGDGQVAALVVAGLCSSAEDGGSDVSLQRSSACSS